MIRGAASQSEATRNERVDELLGILGREGRRAIRVEDMAHGATFDVLLAALKNAGIGKPDIGNFAQSTAIIRPDAGAFLSNSVTGALGTIAPGPDTENLTPWLPPWDVTIDQIGISCSTAVAATTCKVTAYASDALGRPAECLGETATIDTATTGTKFVAAAITFKAGRLYWLGVRTSSTQTVRAVAAGSCLALGWTNAATPVQQTKLNRSLAYATPATAWTFSNSQLATGLPPLVLMRVA